MTHKNPQSGVSTLEAAKRAKIGIATLRRWLNAGKVSSSIEIPMPSGKVLRMWTDSDIKKLAEYADSHLGEREGGR